MTCAAWIIMVVVFLGIVSNMVTARYYRRLKERVDEQMKTMLGHARHMDDILAKAKSIERALSVREQNWRGN